MQRILDDRAGDRYLSRCFAGRKRPISSRDWKISCWVLSPSLREMHEDRLCRTFDAFSSFIYSVIRIRENRSLLAVSRYGDSSLDNSWRSIGHASSKCFKRYIRRPNRGRFSNGCHG